MSNDLGIDRSGNGNNWAVTNLAYSDQVVDSPTNNFCTWNPLARRHDVTTLPTMAEGNLQVTGASAGGNATYGLGTIGVSSGKWYFEVYCKNDAGTGFITGISDDNHLGSGTNSAMISYRENGEAYTNGGSSASYGATYTTGDIIGCAFDVDNKTVQFFKNGVSQGTLSSLTINTVSPFQQINTSDVSILNAGQDSSFAGNKTAQGNQDGNEIGDFYYTPPTGFLALCTSNLPDVAVTPSEHFNTVIYSGSGSAQSITGVGFAPDFSWFKSRSNSDYHNVYDSVRGGIKYLLTDLTEAEQTAANGFVSLDSDGFSLDNAGSGGEVNGSGKTYVSWNWKANGSGSSNTDGDINSTVSVNTDAGFSIVSWVGNRGLTDPEIGHGLSKAPEMVILKNRDASRDWTVFVDSLGANKNLVLNSTTATQTGVGRFPAVPTSTTFTTGASDETNATGDNLIAYCFHSVDGYSKVGTYTGNGSQDGPFVYTGFRPAFVMVKSASMGNSETNWVIWDNERNGYNTAGNVQVFGNQSWAEGQRDDNGGAGISDLDILSNGFKHRDSTWAQNGQSGATFIYIAFAETPFKYSNAR